MRADDSHLAELRRPRGRGQGAKRPSRAKSLIRSVILIEPPEIERWMTARAQEALTQRPLRDRALIVVAREEKHDGVDEAKAEPPQI